MKSSTFTSSISAHRIPDSSIPPLMSELGWWLVAAIAAACITMACPSWLMKKVNCGDWMSLTDFSSMRPTS
jgi:hypothetical protein